MNENWQYAIEHDIVSQEEYDSVKGTYDFVIDYKHKVKSKFPSTNVNCTYYGDYKTFEVSCKYCSNCNHCSECFYCSSCTNCSDCRECLLCVDCKKCLTCLHCSYSNHCVYCIKNRVCQDCKYCIACNKIRNSELKITE